MRTRSTTAGWLVALLTVVLGSVAVPTPAEGAQRPVVRTAERQAGPSGVLVVTITTPRGIPGTVRLTSSGRTRMVTKPAAGTRKTVRVRLPVGRWRVSPQQVVTPTAVFESSASPGTVKVRQARTARTAVTYRPAPTVRGLRVTRIDRTRVDLGWTAPAPGAQYVVRRVRGSVPATSVTSGAAVPVSGTGAIASGLSGGTPYAFAVFARSSSAKPWGRPVTTTVTTPGDGATAVVTNPATVRLSGSAAAPTAVTSSGVTVRLPAGVVPAMGQPWVLSPTATLPGGMIGAVSSVAADGRAVTLRPAGVLDAFDYVAVDVPDLGALPVASVARPPAAPPTSGARRVDLDCDTGADASLVVNRDVAPFGHFRATLARRSFLGKDVPVGMTFDGRFGATATASLDVGVAAAASCTVELPALRITLPTAPVPLTLLAEPVIEVEVAGAVEARGLGFSASLGAQFDGYLGVGDDEVNGGVVKDAQVLEPDVTTAEASVTLRAGVEVSVGPGVGNPSAGALVGVAATINPLDASATVVAPTCLELRAGASISASIEARAWLGSLDIERSVPIPGLAGAIEYAGGPYHFPRGCNGTAEYRITSGDLDVSWTWSGGCTNGLGACAGAAGAVLTKSFSEDSAAHLTISGAGDWQLQDGPGQLYLDAPAHIDSWTFAARTDEDYQDGDCSSSRVEQYSGPVDLSSARSWSTQAVLTPAAAGQAPSVTLATTRYNPWDDLPLGEWTGYFQPGLGAMPVDGPASVPFHGSVTSGCGGSEHVEEADGTEPLGSLGDVLAVAVPTQSRRTARSVSVTPVPGCTEAACSYQVVGSESIEFRQQYGDAAGLSDLEGSGGAEVSWSYVVERRQPL